jgi:hypothetical protein
MKNELGRMGFYAIMIILMIVFWKPIAYLSVLIFIVLLTIIIVTMYRASKIREEINKNPEEYFTRQNTLNNTNSDDIIDVEYTEKEVEKNG